jgi:ACDE family multidrug resistance protein
METDKKWDLISLASIPLIMTLGNSMLMPILPEISAKLGVSPFRVSLLITVYSVAAILLIPIAGFLSDRFGRKTVIIPSLILTAAGGAAAGLAAWWMSGTAAYWAVLGGRLLQGVGAAGGAPVVLPLVGDLFRRESEVSKGLGVIETANTFGKVLSPVLGSALAMAVWFLPFLAIPVFSLVSLALVAILVKPPARTQEKPDSKPRFASFIRSAGTLLKRNGRWLSAIFAVGGAIMFILFGVLFYLSETLEERHGIHGIVKGLILAVPLASICLASFVTGKRIGRNMRIMKWVSVAGLLLSALALFTVGSSPRTIGVIAALFVCGIGLGATLPSLDALITEGIDKERRGTITSLYSSMRFIGVALGPPVVSILMKRSDYGVFLIMALASLTAALFALLAIRPKTEGTEAKVQKLRPS